MLLGLHVFSMQYILVQNLKKYNNKKEFDILIQNLALGDRALALAQKVLR